MSLLLYVVGAVALVLGAITIGFGVSIELSFGNSLIVAGTSAAVGGLIVIGLGSVVAQLQRISEALATRTPMRPSRLPEMFEASGASHAGAARVPFPPKPKSGFPNPPPPVEPPLAAPATAEAPAAEVRAAYEASPASEVRPAEDHFAVPPRLPNPDEPPVEVHEEVSLSPFQPAAAPAPTETDEAARPAPPFGFGGTGDRHTETEIDHGWRLPPIPGRPQPEAAPPPVSEEPPIPSATPQTTHFNSMWPAAEPKSAKPATTVFGKAEPEVEPENELKAAPEAAHEAEPEAGSKPEPAVRPAPAEPTEPEAPRGAGEAHTVAILKSGVVDGMGYTLYVDGSIEAELPQGILRFTSINDLRNYLENNGQA